MKIIECRQYSQQWWDVRRGVPTASCFHRIMTPKTKELAAGAKAYAVQLVADLYDAHYGQHDEGFASDAMRTGTAMEPEARRFYEMDNDVDVIEVGFCMDEAGQFGCSPDGLIGEDGAVELKSPNPGTHLGWLLSGNVVPFEHKAQVHGHLIVTGRKWCDFQSYCPGFAPVKCRTTPNDYTDRLNEILGEFWGILESVKERARAILGDPASAATGSGHNAAIFAEWAEESRQFEEANSVNQSEAA